MAYNIKFDLPKSWEIETSSLVEEGDIEISHFEAHLANDKAQKDDAIIDIYVGPMPTDSSAEREALANYEEMIGYDEGEEDMDPLTCWPFRDTKAFGFEAVCDDHSPMRMMCIEVRKDVLAVVCVVAKNDDLLASLMRLLEDKFTLL